MHKLEKSLREKGFNLLAGVDEAGRGPLAGPVVAAEVILPSTYRNKQIQDSKAVTPLVRQQLYVEIKNTAISYATATASWKEIDTMGILDATKLAMRRAILKLDPAPDFFLSDAVPLNVMDIPQMAIVKGDATVFSIAAASILAKVERDQLMVQYHRKYPQYGFNEHVGYGTEIHLKAIKEHGPCPIHRMSFKPFV